MLIKWKDEERFIPAVGKTLKTGDTCEVGDDIGRALIKQGNAKEEKQAKATPTKEDKEE